MARFVKHLWNLYDGVDGALHEWFMAGAFEQDVWEKKQQLEEMKR